MSVVDPLKNLFARKKKSSGQEDDAGGGAAVEQAAADPRAGAPIEAGEVLSEIDPDSDSPESLDAAEQAAEAEKVSVPLLGRRSIATHQRILFTLLAFALLVLGSVAVFAVNQGDKVAQQVKNTGDSLTQSQRLAKSVAQALVGSEQAFVEVRDSANVLARSVRGLRAGDAGLRLDPVAIEFQDDMDKILPLMERAETNAGVVLGQQKILTQVGAALRTINRQSSDLLEIAETVSSLKLQQNASPAEISAAGQLVMLTQRIGKSANEFMTASEGLSPEAVFLLGKDLNSFKEIAQGLLEGSPELRLGGTKDAQTRERLESLLKVYEETRTQASAILGNLQGLVSAREAQAAIIADSEPLRRSMEELQGKLSLQTGLGAGAIGALALAWVRVSS